MSPDDIESDDFLPYKHEALEFYAKYIAKEILGRGASSVVRRVIEKDTGLQFAAKVIDIHGDQTDKEEMKEIYESTMKEVQALRILSGHPNIIELHDVFSSPAFIFLVLELCAKGELFDFLNRVVNLSEKKTRIIMKQLLEAVAYMHDHDIIHRDLKLENILMDDDLNIKVTDFGFAVILPDKKGLSELCGTAGYLAPEVLKCSMYENQEPYGKAVDLWACGVIMYTMLAGYPPFWHRKQIVMLRQIMEGQYSFASPEWHDITDEPKDLIRRFLTVDPLKRITVKEALNHDFFRIKTHLDVHVKAGIRLKRCFLLVRAAIRLSRLHLTPQPIKKSHLQKDPYKIRMARKAVDICAFRMYGHWVHKGEEQNRAVLFQNSLKLEMKNLRKDQKAG